MCASIVRFWSRYTPRFLTSRTLGDNTISKGEMYVSKWVMLFLSREEDHFCFALIELHIFSDIQQLTSLAHLSMLAVSLEMSSPGVMVVSHWRRYDISSRGT